MKPATSVVFRDQGSSVASRPKSRGRHKNIGGNRWTGAASLALPQPHWQRRHSQPHPGRRITRRARSLSSIHSRPAARSMSSAGRSPPGSSRCSSSRSWSRPRRAQPVRWARNSPPTPGPTVIRLSRTCRRSRVSRKSTNCSAARRSSPVPTSSRSRGLTEGPMVLVVNDQVPYKTLKEFIDDAKANPNKLIFSSSGLYGALHLPAALMIKATGIQLRHLPTAGGGPALTAVLGNNAQALVSSVAAANAQIKAGKLRALVASRPSARRRSPTCRRSRSSATTWSSRSGSVCSRPRARPMRRSRGCGKRPRR